MIYEVVAVGKNTETTEGAKRMTERTRWRVEGSKREEPRQGKLKRETEKEGRARSIARPWSINEFDLERIRHEETSLICKLNYDNDRSGRSLAIIYKFNVKWAGWIWKVRRPSGEETARRTAAR